MKKLSKKQERFLLRLWDKAGPELERIRREQLRGLPYNWKDVDALLEMGDYYEGPRRTTSGLVEMQRRFIKAARRQGPLPAAREEPATYGALPLRVLGGVALPAAPRLALLCSIKCPGRLIPETYDLCRRLGIDGITVVSGFHSPMERECLAVLLRYPNRAIWCLARGILKAIPRELRKAADNGRLAIVSPFPEKVRHVTAKTAAIRNRVVAGMATAVFVPHAAPGSRIEALCREIRATGKALYTFDHPSNAALLRSGAKVVSVHSDWKQILK